MSRLPFQVLVLPYRRTPSDELEYAVFQRANEGYWQFVAGGGEDDETAQEAARREAWEEADIPQESAFTPLQAMCMVSVTSFEMVWPPLPSGEARYVIPEYAFAVDIADCILTISEEHTAFSWLRYPEALARLHFDSNRTALWELNQRLLGKGPRD